MIIILIIINIYIDSILLTFENSDISYERDLIKNVCVHFQKLWYKMSEEIMTTVIGTTNVPKALKRKWAVVYNGAVR